MAKPPGAATPPGAPKVGAGGAPKAGAGGATAAPLKAGAGGAAAAAPPKPPSPKAGAGGAAVVAVLPPNVKAVEGAGSFAGGPDAPNENPAAGAVLGAAAGTGAAGVVLEAPPKEKAAAGAGAGAFAGVESLAGFEVALVPKLNAGVAAGPGAVVTGAGEAPPKLKDDFSSFFSDEGVAGAGAGVAADADASSFLVA